MKTHLYLTIILLVANIDISMAQHPSRVNVNGTWYTDGQTAYISCSQSDINIYIDCYQECTNCQCSDLILGLPSNFTAEDDPNNALGSILHLDSNHQDGYIHAYLSDGDNTFMTVTIIQKPPVPVFTASPILCSASSTATYSVSDGYTFQSTSPINIVWQTTGGVTVNGGNTYTTTSSTTGSVTIQYNSFGTLTVYAVIPGCNNLQGNAISLPFGPPYINDVTVDNSLNPGPYPVTSGSTHYIQASAISRDGPSYSLSTTTNSGDLNLSLSGINSGNCEIYAYGTVGNASVDIVASNSCGSTTRHVIFYIPASYRAAPNPAKNSVAVTFSSTEDEIALPDQLEIVSEKEMKTVRVVDIKKVFKDKSFKDKNTIDFNISDLPRGTYYLRVTNPRQVTDKQVEMTRLIFE